MAYREMSTQAAHAPQTRTLHSIHPAWLAIAAGLLLIVIALIGIVVLITPLPDLGAAPSYQLINQDEQAVSDLNLRGQIVVYNFIYTSCTTVCPALTGQMMQIQNQLAAENRLGSDVVLVTMTFDPERDTPARLREYTNQMGVEPDSWLWLTGEPVEMRQLVGAEFGVYFEKIASDEGAEHGHEGYGFAHDTAFILVDEQGIVRAEYAQFPGVKQVLQDIQMLVMEKNAQGIQRLIWQTAHWLKDNR